MPKGVYIGKRSGGPKKGHIINEETKAKISAANEGKKRTEETKAKISAAAKIAQNKSEVKDKKSSALTGREIVWRDKISDAKIGEKNHNWKGGLSCYYHKKARELFGKPLCEDCGIFLEDYRLTHKKKQFEMHCVSKDYTILEQWNWQCLCRKCHAKTFRR